MDVAVDHCRVGRLRSHLNDFYVEIVFLEGFPLLRREKMETTNRWARDGNPDFTLCFLPAYWHCQPEQQTTEPNHRSESKSLPKTLCFHAELRPEFNEAIHELKLACKQMKNPGVSSPIPPSSFRRKPESRASYPRLTWIPPFAGMTDPRSVPLQARSEEHTSELQSRFGISYAVFCLKKKT